jgi:hypothetical protein
VFFDFFFSDFFGLTNLFFWPDIVKREVGIKFMDLRKIHYNVVRNSMDPNEADVLAGRAKTVSAQPYALYHLDKMTESYIQEWEKFGTRFS